MPAYHRVVIFPSFSRLFFESRSVSLRAQLLGGAYQRVVRASTKRLRLTTSVVDAMP
jgi:hypothetical protein